jgi:uncharacterized membrane protein YkgB
LNKKRYLNSFVVIMCLVILLNLVNNTLGVSVDLVIMITDLKCLHFLCINQSVISFQ